jgi:DNA-binding transcriptional MerR regulator
MPIKEIKHFIDWCSDGDSTLQIRYELFMERKASVEAQMEELKKQWNSSITNVCITRLLWMLERKIFIKMEKYSLLNNR